MDAQLLTASPRGQSDCLGEPSAKKNPRFPFLTKCVVILCTLGFCLIMLEVGLRLTGRYRMGEVSGYFATGGLSYVLKSNASKTVFWPERSWNVYTCDRGFRAERPGPRPLGRNPYYAVVGASEVFGNGLNYEQTFIGVFAEKMKAHNVDVLNMAVGGHHFMEQDVVFREFVPTAPRLPDTVLICFNPLFIGGYDDVHTNTVVRKGEIFDEDNWKMALTKMVLGNSSAVFCFLRDGLRNIQRKYSQREDFALSFYIERYSTKHRIRAPEKTQDFLKRVKDLERYVRSLGSTPVCVYSPTVGGFLLDELKAKGKLDADLIDTQFFVNLLQTHCKEEGIQFINFEPPLREKYNRGEKLNFEGDAHFNEATSRLVGEYLYAALKPSKSRETE